MSDYLIKNVLDLAYNHVTIRLVVMLFHPIFSRILQECLLHKQAMRCRQIYRTVSTKPGKLTMKSARNVSNYEKI